MTRALENQIADGETVEIPDGAGATARISLLVSFPKSVREGAGYRFSNVWSLAISEDGATLWVIDASTNTLARVATATGRYQIVMRFEALPNVGPIGPPVVDSVPTGVRVYGDQLLVSFLTGFPFTQGYARVLAVDPVQRRAEPFIFGLTSAVDVLWRGRATGPAQFFTLEFSLNQTATPAGPGRLMRFDSSTPQIVASDLRAPVAMEFDAATEELFILEVSGRILRVSAR